MSKVDPEFLDIYFEEMGDLFADLPDRVAALRADPSDPETITVLRRLAHTMKNSAGLMRFTAVQALAKALERAMDAVKTGELGGADDIETACGAFEFLHAANVRLRDTGDEDADGLARKTRVVEDLLRHVRPRTT